jgi:phage recombination protein Bet
MASQQPAKQQGVQLEPRLPYPGKQVHEKFGVGQSDWKTLTDMIFPAAKTSQTIITALAYCKSRGLDPMKRPVHIVPYYGKSGWQEQIMPSINELRTTAHRTGLYGGRDETVFGPEIHDNFPGYNVTHPEWAQVTGYRFVGGHKAQFTGPKVFWSEAFQKDKHGNPNSMWRQRPYGQLDKCAEAAFLRTAFPEEIGEAYVDSEAEFAPATTSTETVVEAEPQRPEPEADWSKRHGDVIGTLVDEVGEAIAEIRDKSVTGDQVEQVELYLGDLVQQRLLTTDQCNQVIENNRALLGQCGATEVAMEVLGLIGPDEPEPAPQPAPQPAPSAIASLWPSDVPAEKMEDVSVDAMGADDLCQVLDAAKNSFEAASRSLQAQYETFQKYSEADQKKVLDKWKEIRAHHKQGDQQ